MSKALVIGAVVVIIGIFFLGGFLLLEWSTKSESDERKVISQPIGTSLSFEKSKRCEYGTLSEEVYLDTYIVKPGDTLLSIADRELGSPARINEIINLNGSSYNGFIRAGQILSLPTDFLPSSSGILIVREGKLRLDDAGPFAGKLIMQINSNVSPVGPLVNFAENARFFETDNFQAEDCVTIVLDFRNVDSFKAIALAPQGNHEVFRTPTIVYEKDEVELPLATSQCLFSPIGSEEVLRGYIVKRGDTLYSIAKEQVGDSSRFEEIREINKKQYGSLNGNDFIEVGWELLLPPLWTNSFSDFYLGYVGILARNDDKGFSLASNISNPELLNMDFIKDPQIVYFGRDGFSKGDCVAIFFSEGRRVLGMASQDDDYARYFKYGE